MKIEHTLATTGFLAGLVLIAGCSGTGAQDAADLGLDGSAAEAGQDRGQEFDYAPTETEASTAKPLPTRDLSGKGSITRRYGKTFKKQLTIPPNEGVGCYTAGGSPANVDPVLVLYRRVDNLHQEWPMERVRMKTLAINDDSYGLHSYISYSNTTGYTEYAYLMAFAYGDNVGVVDLWCTGSAMETVQVAAGSYATYGTTDWVAMTSGSKPDPGQQGGPDPWLYMFDPNVGTEKGLWNDDYSTSRESVIFYPPTGQWFWYVVHGHESGTTTINY